MTFQCIGCHEKFSSEDILLKHIVKSRCDPIYFTGFSKKDIYICSKDPFADKIGYKNILFTLQKHYRFNNIKEYQLIEKMIRLYIENINVLKTKDKISKDGEGNKQCPYCFKTFSTDSNLLKHIRNVCIHEKEFVATEEKPFTWKTILSKVDIIKEVLDEMGYHCEIEKLLKNKKLDFIKKTSIGINEMSEYHLLTFLKRNPLFTFDMKDSRKYMDERILNKPKVKMYENKNFTQSVNSFDECLELRHIYSDYFFLVQKDSMFLFIQKYLSLSKNMNVYVESIKDMRVVIYYRNIVFGNEIEKKNVLFRPTNVLYVFKNWIKTIYILMMDIIRVYIYESNKIDDSIRVSFYRMIRKNVQMQYADIMKHVSNLKMYVKRILCLFERDHEITKMNFQNEVVDNTIYTGEIFIYNKLLDDVLINTSKEEKKKDIDEMSVFLGLYETDQKTLEFSLCENSLSDTEMMRLGNDLPNMIEMEEESVGDEDESKMSEED